MSDDQIIDKILAELNRQRGGTMFVASYCEDLGLDDFAYIAFVDRLEAEGLATKGSPGHRMTITDFGRQVCKNGGWLLQVDTINANKKAAANDKQLASEKLRHDTKISRWQVKTFWWIFFGGFIGGLMGATSLVLELEGRGYIALPIQLRQNRPLDKPALPDSTANPNAGQNINSADNPSSAPDNLETKK